MCRRGRCTARSRPIVDADEAADLKEEASENLRPYNLSRTRTVASELGITTTKLNTGFRAARKALVLKRIDAAVEDGDLTDEEQPTSRSNWLTPSSRATSPQAAASASASGPATEVVEAKAG